MSPPKTISSSSETVAVDRGTPSALGRRFSAMGRITIKAAPRNDPRIDPSPPMITMNSSSNERFTSKASGSHPPR